MMFTADEKLGFEAAVTALGAYLVCVSREDQCHDDVLYDHFFPVFFLLSVPNITAENIHLSITLLVFVLRLTHLH